MNKELGLFLCLEVIFVALTSIGIFRGTDLSTIMAYVLFLFFLPTMVLISWYLRRRGIAKKKHYLFIGIESVVLLFWSGVLEGEKDMKISSHFQLC